MYKSKANLLFLRRRACVFARFVMQYMRQDGFCEPSRRGECENDLVKSEEWRVKSEYKKRNLSQTRVRLRFLL